MTWWTGDHVMDKGVAGELGLSPGTWRHTHLDTHADTNTWLVLLAMLVAGTVTTDQSSSTARIHARNKTGKRRI